MSKKNIDLDDPKCTYKPEYEQLVIQHAKNGMFLEEIAECFEVTPKTLIDWKHRIPAFGKAHARAKNIIVTGLMKKLVNCATQRDSNSRPLEFILNLILHQMRDAPVVVEGIAKGDINDKINCVLKALESELLRADQAEQLISTLKTVQDIQAGKEALDKLEKLESLNK